MDRSRQSRVAQWHEYDHVARNDDIYLNLHHPKSEFKSINNINVFLQLTFHVTELDSLIRTDEGNRPYGLQS